MIKAFSLLIIGFILLMAIPICIGIAGGFFGLIMGLIGGIIGFVFATIGALFSGIAWIFSGLFHLLFGWTGHHHGFHFNGYLIAAIIIAVIALSTHKKK